MTHPNLFRASLAAAAITLFGAALPASAQAAPPAAPTAPDAKAKTKTLAIVLFPRFETLDVFGPVEMWGRLEDDKIVSVSEHGGVITSAQGADTVTTYSFAPV